MNVFFAPLPTPTPTPVQVEFERYDHVNVALTPNLAASGTLFTKAAATIFGRKGKLAFEQLLHMWVS